MGLELMEPQVMGPKLTEVEIYVNDVFYWMIVWWNKWLIKNIYLVTIWLKYNLKAWDILMLLCFLFE